MIMIELQYDAYTRTFKPLDSEAGELFDHHPGLFALGFRHAHHSCSFHKFPEQSLAVAPA